MERTSQPELLDQADADPREVERSLADLRMVNRLFGGISTSEKLLRRVVARSGLRELSVLDVGAGSGDVPLEVARRFGREGTSLRLTLVDQHESHFPSQNVDHVSTVVGDALHLPFAENSFDVVSCSLFLHHLEPAEARAFVAQALRIARHAVVINDLVRSRMHYFVASLGFPFFRSEMSRIDGRISIKRAYTPKEVREMLSGVGAGLEISRHYLYRMGVVVWN